VNASEDRCAESPCTNPTWVCGTLIVPSVAGDNGFATEKKVKDPVYHDSLDVLWIDI
jgi:hypothetical protein